MNGSGDMQIRNVREGPNPGLEILDPLEKEQSVVWLRQRWQFVAVLRFLHKFSKNIGLQGVTADRLENAIADASSEKIFCSEMFSNLASSSTPDPKHAGFPWEALLSKRLEEEVFTEDAASGQSWSSMTLYAKLKALLGICSWKARKDEGISLACQQSGLDPMSLEAVRSDLIGVDSMGRRFYFSPQGCQTGRLYIEQPADHQSPRGGLGERGSWSMLCASASEVQQVARQLQESQHPGEQRLVAKLAGEIIPLMGGVGSGCGTVDDPKQAPGRLGETGKSGQGADNDGAGSAWRSRQDTEVSGSGHHEVRAQLEGRMDVAGAGMPAGAGSTSANRSPLSILIPQPAQPTDIRQHSVPTPRKRQHPPGWSPLGCDVHTKTRKLDTRPATAFEPLLAQVNGGAELPLKRSRQLLASEATQHKPEVEPPLYVLEATEEPARAETSSVRHRKTLKMGREMANEEKQMEDSQPEPSKSGGRAHLTRHRPSRKRKEMEDEDYEEEEESEASESDSDVEEYRAKPKKGHSQIARSAAAAAAAAKKRAQSQRSFQPPARSLLPPSNMFANVDDEYRHYARKLQEHEKAQRAAIAMKYPYHGPERENLLRSLQFQLERKLEELKTWHAQKRDVQERERARQGMGGSLSLHQSGLDLTQKQYSVQKQDLTQLAASFSPQQRAAFQSLSSQDQYQYLEQMRRARAGGQMPRQQAAPMGDLQRAALQQLSPEHIHALRQLSPAKQQETITKLTHHYLHNQQVMQQRRQQQERLGANGGVTEGIGADLPSQGSGQTRLGSIGPVSPSLRDSSTGGGALGGEHTSGGSSGRTQGINVASTQQNTGFPGMRSADQGRQFLEPFSGRPSPGQSAVSMPAMSSHRMQFFGQGSPASQLGREASSLPMQGMMPMGMQTGMPGFGGNHFINRPASAGQGGPLLAGLPNGSALSAGHSPTLAGSIRSLGQSSPSPMMASLYLSLPGRRPSPVGNLLQAGGSAGLQMQNGSIRSGTMAGSSSVPSPVAADSRHLQFSQQQPGVQGGQEMGGGPSTPAPQASPQKAFSGACEAGAPGELDEVHKGSADPAEDPMEDFADLAACFLSQPPGPGLEPSGDGISTSLEGRAGQLHPAIQTGVGVEQAVNMAPALAGGGRSSREFLAKLPHSAAANAENSDVAGEKN